MLQIMTESRAISPSHSTKTVKQIQLSVKVHCTTHQGPLHNTVM